MATYYIDADNGSDAADGLSPTNAWLTWSHLVSASVAHASTVYLRRCDTMYVTTTNDWLNGITGACPPWASFNIVGDNGTYGITEWASDTTNVILGNTAATYALRFSTYAEYGVSFHNIQFAAPNYRMFRFRPGGRIQFIHCKFLGSGSTDANNIGQEAFYAEYGDNARIEFIGCEFRDFNSTSYSIIRGVYDAKDYYFYGCIFDNISSLIKNNVCNSNYFFYDSTIQYDVALMDWNGLQAWQPGLVAIERCHVRGTNGLLNYHSGTDGYIIRDDHANSDDTWACLHQEERAICYLNDINGVPGPFGREGPRWVLAYDSTSTSQLRVGGGTSFIKFRPYRLIGSATYPSRLEDSTTRILLSHMVFDLPNANGATQYTASMYGMADGGWGNAGVGGTDDKFYLEVEYLSGSTGEENTTYSRVQSAQDISNDSTWTEFSVNFTPSRPGPAVAQVWISDYHSDSAFVYLDNFLEVAES